ncbi:hypothetical protein LIER_21494 [Lithospermum erythrorhizon]|uniref:Uncharacterized protein n=1 Tax=Lithospermum erythrorhizon TaxID=34254 RepID=A0AAV3QQK3_LITER
MRTLSRTRWRPSSFQVRLGLNCRKSGGVIVRVQKQLNHNRSRICCVSNSPNNNNNNNSTNTHADDANAFAGWSSSPQDSHSTQLPGIVGAGLAGIFLVAGLMFAAFSIANKRTSKSIQQMEPLTIQQETSLASEDHDEQKKKDVTDMSQTKIEESKTGINQDTSFYYDNNKVSESGNRVDYDEGLSNDTNMTSETSKDYGSAVTEVGSNSTISEIEDYSIVSATFENRDGSVLQCKDDNFVNGTPDSVSAPLSSGLFNDDKTYESVTDTSMIDHSVFDAKTETLSSVQQQVASGLQERGHSPDSSSGLSNEDSISSNVLVSSQLDLTIEPQMFHKDEGLFTVTEVNKDTLDLPIEKNNSSFEAHNYKKDALTGSDVISPLQDLSVTEEGNNVLDDANVSGMSSGSSSLLSNFTYAGVPAPSLASASLQSHPGKVLVPAVVDPVQGQALAALQVLKVIETDVQPGNLCTRREYACWLVSASSALSRNTISKVYPAMYIENITELAFDDITPKDPDFSSIQGLAEAGLISSKLSKHDMQSSVDDEHTPLYFSPESPLSRQDLVSWKMALEKRQLPVVNRKSMEQLSGFIDIDKIHPDAWPALVADLALGEHGIVALAFGYTRLFQPDKPVTNAQAAVAIATGEASDIVNEELARIEAETMAEKAVAAQSELVAQVEKEINASFEKDLKLEREKVVAVEKVTDEARQELQRLMSQREEENFAIIKERAAVDSEMEVFSKLRREVEEQLQALMSNKVEISYEKELLNKLRKDAESENREIARLQYELEVERKALSIARAWAEDEAKRAREQAKALEEARGRWESQGIKVIVDDDLREEANAGVTWLSAGKEFSVEGTVERAENLVDRLKRMAGVVRGRSKDIINTITLKILSVISVLKEFALKAGQRAEVVKDGAFSQMSRSLEEVQQSSAVLTSTAKEGIQRMVIDCKDGVGKFTQKFKT